MKDSRLLANYSNLVQDGLYMKPDHDALNFCALGIIGEAAKLGGLLQAIHLFGQPDEVNEKAMVERLGMLLWYLTNCTVRLGLTLEQLAVANIVDLSGREPASYSVDTLMRGVE